MARQLDILVSMDKFRTLFYFPFVSFFLNIYFNYVFFHHESRNQLRYHLRNEYRLQWISKTLYLLSQLYTMACYFSFFSLCYLPMCGVFDLSLTPSIFHSSVVFIIMFMFLMLPKYFICLIFISVISFLFIPSLSMTSTLDCFQITKRTHLEHNKYDV